MYRDERNCVKGKILQPHLQIDRHSLFCKLGELLDKQLGAFDSVGLHCDQTCHRVQRSHLSPSRGMHVWIELGEKVRHLVPGIVRGDVPFALASCQFVSSSASRGTDVHTYLDKVCSMAVDHGYGIHIINRIVARGNSHDRSIFLV